MSKRVRIPAAQLRALRSARDHGDPTHHLRGRSEWGGWAWTCGALRRQEYLDQEMKLTDKGRKALAAYDTVL